MKQQKDTQALPIQQKVITLLENALQLSQSPQREDEHSIHTIRVTLKQLRAYWRLMRFTVKRSVFQVAEQRIRLTAKQLAGQRDQQVLRTSLLIIANQLKTVDKAIIKKLMDELNPSSTEALSSTDIPWPAVISALHLERDLWQNLACTSDQNKYIQKGLQHTLNRSHQLAQKATRKKADISQRHQWRKWVKYSYYQLKLLKKLGLTDAKNRKKTIKLLNTLGEVLGQEHDFEALHSFLEQQALAHLSMHKTLKRMMKVNHQHLKALTTQANHLHKTLKHRL